MWESLAAGAIPVVKRSQAMEPFRELPILFVDRYEEVTLELLEDAAGRIIPATTENPMLQVEYWTGQIRDAKLALKGRELMPRKDWIMESFKHGSGSIRRKLFN
jgi:hypothetical protein